jgi:signal transduction histidine kinase
MVWNRSIPDQCHALFGETMRIAIVGGNQRCAELIDMIEKHTFHEISPRVVAVADPDPQAPGAVAARSRQLFVTADYNDFFKRDDIDLILELLGSMDVYNDILAKKSPDVRAISKASAVLFWEIARVSQLHRQTDRELQKAQAMYETVLNELIHEDVMILSSDHHIIDVNETMLRKIGLPREKIIGRPCYEVTHHLTEPCTGEYHPCPLDETLKTGKASKATHVHFDRNNRKIFYAISCYPLWEDGRIVGAIEISRDITKEINMQKAMMLQEKMASIGRLSAGVAHEINNPLTTILTTAMLLQEDLDCDDPLYEELKAISDETLRCRKIVKGLLDFARQNKPEKKLNDINAIVSESVMLTKKQAAFTDVTVAPKLTADIPLLRVDKGQIQQALINLIINAAEASRAGDTVEVTTHLNRIDCMAEVEVRDNGTGMSEETVARIFDPFFTLKEDGNGLGLAITHGIIEQHGGAIEVDSVPDQGTRFIVRLPLEKSVQDG